VRRDIGREKNSRVGGGDRGFARPGRKGEDKRHNKKRGGLEKREKFMICRGRKSSASNSSGSSRIGKRGWRKTVIEEGRSFLQKYGASRKN